MKEIYVIADRNYITERFIHSSNKSADHVYYVFPKKCNGVSILLDNPLMDIIDVIEE